MYWMKTNMAVFSAVADEAFVRNLVTRGVSHGEISDIYRSQYPHMRGLTERSVGRFCNERSIPVSLDHINLPYVTNLYGFFKSHVTTPFLNVICSSSLSHFLSLS